MPKSSDPLAAALNEAKPGGTSNQSKVHALFGDRPEVLEAIRRARRDRKLGYAQISRIISQVEPDRAVKAGAIKNWLQSEGIE